MTMEAALVELGKAVWLAQDNASQLGEVRATLFVNFGPRNRELYGFQIDPEQNNASTIKLLMFVLQKLVERGNPPPAKTTKPAKSEPGSGG